MKKRINKEKKNENKKQKYTALHGFLLGILSILIVFIRQRLNLSFLLLNILGLIFGIFGFILSSLSARNKEILIANFGIIIGFLGIISNILFWHNFESCC